MLRRSRPKKKRPSIDKSVLAFPTFKRMEDPEYLKSYKGSRCIVPECSHNQETVVGCHIRSGRLGMSVKPSDWHTLSMCAEHHRIQHEIGEERFYSEYLGWTIKQAKEIAYQRYRSWLNG